MRHMKLRPCAHHVGLGIVSGLTSTKPLAEVP